MEVICDYDNCKWKNVLRRHRKIAHIWCGHNGLIIESVEVKARGWYHFHVTMATNFEDPKDILILQLAMGSHYLRESYNWSRLGSRDVLERWNYLYLRKRANKKDYTWSEKRSKELALIWDKAMRW